MGKNYEGTSEGGKIMEQKPEQKEEPVYCEDCFHFTRLCNKAVSDKVMYANCMGWRAKNDDPTEKEA